MSRVSRRRQLPLLVIAVLFLAPLFAACGGGGGSGGRAVDADLMVTYFNLKGRTDVYRNALLEFRLTAPVKESSVDDRTFRILSGPQMQTPTNGARIVDGDRIYFDVTRSQGAYERGDIYPDQPFGFEALNTYQVFFPGPESEKTIRNLSGDKIVAEYRASFTTNDLFIPEKVQPTWIGYSFSPPPNEDGTINYEADIVLEFDEPIDPASVEPGTTVLVYRTITISGPSGSTTKSGEYPVSASASRDGTLIYLTPAVNWGSEAQVTVTITEGITDLAGNPVVPRPQNPSQTNPFTFLSEYKEGLTLVDFVVETFDDNDYEDLVGITDPGEWNTVVEGALTGGEITSSTNKAAPKVPWWTGSSGSEGIFGPAYPMVAYPATAACVIQPNGVSWQNGCRLQTGIPKSLMGPAGSITDLDWAPASGRPAGTNPGYPPSTFATTYSNFEVRLGHTNDDLAVLGTDFAGNYRDGQPLPHYEGSYSLPTLILPSSYYDADNDAWYPYPTLTTPFDYDGTSGVIVDYSISAGSQCQAQYVWAYVFLTGGPGRHISGAQDRNASQDSGFITYGGRTPEIIYWTRFTKKRRVTNAQSLFYDTDIFAPDYGQAIVSPAVQPGGATYTLEFQGADGRVDPQDPNQTAIIPDPNTYTNWSLDPNVCDGKRFIRFRIRLVANLVSNTVPRIASIQIPYSFQQS